MRPRIQEFSYAIPGGRLVEVRRDPNPVQLDRWQRLRRMVALIARGPIRGRDLMERFAIGERTLKQDIRDIRREPRVEARVLLRVPYGPFHRYRFEIEEVLELWIDGEPEPLP